MEKSFKFITYKSPESEVLQMENQRIRNIKYILT